MSGSPMSGLPRKPYVTIELPAWKWVAVCVASPFALMLALKLSWETLYWWSRVVFAEQIAEEAFAGVAFGLSWLGAIIATAGMIFEGVVKLKIKEHQPRASG
jgi:hypothetical protein